MGRSFFFYDVETSGINPAESRIMQFAGQRTDSGLNPIGPPFNYLIKLTEDILPDPQAILITGITPQQTLQSGISEAQFLKRFYSEAATAGTIFIGYNSVRFDDEFMRYINYRNFYDPYEWQWQDNRGRWDLLDVVRMTRALRPEGINWPFDAQHKATNRLEMLTSVNNLDHEHAHDALNDVMACIALSRLIYEKQPKLFSFLLRMHDKKNVAKLVLANQPFIYTSGKYPSDFEKTTVVCTLTEHPHRQAALVYDLRYDPEIFCNMSISQLVEAWRYSKDPDKLRLPIKTLSFNRCPAVAPLTVLDTVSAKRLKLDKALILKNYQKLMNHTDWPDKILQALDILDNEQQKRSFKRYTSVDSQLYSGFFSNHDRQTMHTLRGSEPNKLHQFVDQFEDTRLKKLLPLYKARNFPELLSSAELKMWRNYVRQKLYKGASKSLMSGFENSIIEITKAGYVAKNQQKLLKKLQDYATTVSAMADDVDS